MRGKMENMIRSIAKGNEINIDGFNSIRDEESLQKQIAFTSYLMETTWDDDICDGDINKEYIKEKLGRWNKHWLPALNEEHSGDCTKQCHPCSRCYTERFINLAKLILEEI